MSFTGKRILVTGVTGQVRLSGRLGVRTRQRGVRPRPLQSRQGPGRGRGRGGPCRCRPTSTRETSRAIPEGLDYVLHFAVAKGGVPELPLVTSPRNGGRSRAPDVRGAADGRGLPSLLLRRGLRARRSPRLREEDPLGDNHPQLHAHLQPQQDRDRSRTCASPCGPARPPHDHRALQRAPYGDNGGWPFWHPHDDEAGSGHRRETARSRTSTIRSTRTTTSGRSPASSPRPSHTRATTVNWGGSEAVSIEEWTAYLGELTGLEPKLNYQDHYLGSLRLDPTRNARARGGDAGAVARGFPPHGGGEGSRSPEAIERISSRGASRCSRGCRSPSPPPRSSGFPPPRRATRARGARSSSVHRRRAGGAGCRSRAAAFASASELAAVGHRGLSARRASGRGSGPSATTGA